jgi:hypothetical protein
MAAMACALATTCATSWAALSLTFKVFLLSSLSANQRFFASIFARNLSIAWAVAPMV